MTNSRFRRLGDYKPQPQSALWEGRVFNGSITVLQGEPGTCKTTIVSHLVGCLTGGRPMPGSTAAAPVRGAVIVTNEDDPARVLLPSVLASGGDPNRVIVLSRRDAVMLPESIEPLVAAVDEVDAGLIAISPISDFSLLSLQGEQSARRALAPIQELVASRDIACISTRHLAKSSRRAKHAGLGSIGITAMARSELLTAVDPAQPDSFLLAVSKSNLAIQPTIRFQVGSQNGAMRITWLEEVITSADELLSQESGHSLRQLEYAQDVLYAFLESGPKSAKAVEKHAHNNSVKTATLIRAKDELKVRAVLKHDGRHQEWWNCLPRDERALRAVKLREIDRLADMLLHGDPLDGIDADRVDQSTNLPDNGRFGS